MYTTNENEVLNSVTVNLSSCKDYEKMIFGLSKYGTCAIFILVLMLSDDNLVYVHMHENELAGYSFIELNFNLKIFSVMI